MNKSHTRPHSTPTPPVQSEDLASIITAAEALEAVGEQQGAIRVYQQWLTDSSSPMAWAGYFNLGILLKETGDLPAAQRAFAAALEQSPGFAPAREALALVTPAERVATDTGNVHLFSLAWSPEMLAQTDPAIAILDNSANLRPDWREYWPMRHYLLNTPLNEKAYYGFLSPKFTSKTGLMGYDVIRFVHEYPEAEVFTFSPQADMGAFFLNVFEQGDLFDSGFLTTCQDLLTHLGYQVDLQTLIMDSRQIIFSNFIVARPAFWRQWLALCEKIFQFAETANSPLADKINAPTTYPGQVPRKVFVIERIASLILASSPWKCKPYSTYQCAWSALPTSEFKAEAIASDALKLAYNDTQDKTYLNTYGELRHRVFSQNTPPDHHPQLLIKVVENYAALVPLDQLQQKPQGDSASPKSLIFHIFEDNSLPIEVLDIGFGAGNLGALLKNNPSTAHWTVDGVDGFKANCHNENLIEQAIYRNIWHGLAQDIPSEQFAKYHIICLLDVIEHLPVDIAKQLLRDLLVSMNEDAYLFISTPLWFYPQDTMQEGDLEEHLIGVPATSMMALMPKMYAISHPLVGGFVLGKRSLPFVDFFHPTADKNFSYQQGLEIAQAIGCHCEPGSLVKLW